MAFQDVSDLALADRASELRQDLVTGDWVTIATGRARRPNAFASQREFLHDAIETCPFEDLEKSGNAPLPLAYQREGGSWSVQVIPNKYPAFTRGDLGCPLTLDHGPYSWMEGRGFHEVVVLADHYRSIAELPLEAVAELFRAYRERYLALRDEGCVNFIAIFHNHGREAGASLTHPHSQLIAIPAVPPDVSRSLEGSERYYEGHRQCVHCVMLDFERREQKRLIFENDGFVALAPYVSRAAFEIRIFPKNHEPHFATMNPSEERQAAEALKISLWKLHRGLGNPAYNFFIHTVPVRGHQYDHYHWHIEIVPKSQVWAGFEIGTGIEISTIDPDAAAEFLRSLEK